MSGSAGFLHQHAIGLETTFAPIWERHFPRFCRHLLYVLIMARSGVYETRGSPVSKIVVRLVPVRRWVGPAHRHDSRPSIVFTAFSSFPPASSGRPGGAPSLRASLPCRTGDSVHPGKACRVGGASCNHSQGTRRCLEIPFYLGVAQLPPWDRSWISLQHRIAIQRMEIPLSVARR